MSNEERKMVTQIVKSLIQGVGPKGFFVCLHNAMIHGEVFEEMGLEMSDEQLGEMFDHVDRLIVISKEIEG